MEEHVTRSRDRLLQQELSYKVASGSFAETCP